MNKKAVVQIFGLLSLLTVLSFLGNVSPVYADEPELQSLGTVYKEDDDLYFSFQGSGLRMAIEKIDPDTKRRTKIWNNGGKTFTLYSMHTNGTNKEKIKTFKTSSYDNGIYLYEDSVLVRANTVSYGNDGYPVDSKALILTAPEKRCVSPKITVLKEVALPEVVRWTDTAISHRLKILIFSTKKALRQVRQALS